MGRLTEPPASKSGAGVVQDVGRKRTLKDGDLADQAGALKRRKNGNSSKIAEQMICG